MKINTYTTIGLAVLAGVFLVSPAPAAVSIAYVPVGNPGNAADPATDSLYGAVDYEYRIAQNETTISEYAAFLNAVAATDSYGLYSTSMGTDAKIAGIQRSGTSGSYTYSVLGSGTRPVTYVSWFDAARFANWLHNGQPSGLQTSLTTEDGAYKLNGATSGVGFSKNAGATVWIPTENEWYKAAYYDPNKGGPGVGGYWLHATQSDTLSGNTIGVANSANFNDGDYVGSGTSTFPTGNALTEVGAYGLSSQSAYGTNDQAGNVLEWNDAVIGSSLGLRGGSWANSAGSLAASTRGSLTPTDQHSLVGFRVASVPEPTALLLTILTGCAWSLRRRRSSL